MAKMKTHAVEIEIVTRRTVYVQARRPNGAIEVLKTREGWMQAVGYTEDAVLQDHFQFDDKTMTVVGTREV